jgi:Questin oxidase-like
MGDVVDEALGVFADTGPEYEAFGGRASFANHGPMVVEALCAMGREDAVMDWAERYRPRLAGRPPSQASIPRSEWPDALGDMSRVRDWADLFDAELAASPWPDVLNRWLPRLAPGMVFALHGAIRTAHAVRSLGRAETTRRLHELAEGLAYWAAQYETLPESNGPSGGLLPSQAIAGLEQLALADRTGWIRFTDPIRKLADSPSFGSAADLIDTHGDVSVIVADLSRAFSAILVANNPSVNPRALCHGLTGGTLTEMMQPHLAGDATHASLRYGWQTAAAFYCATVLQPPIDEVDPPAEGIDAIIDEALACPDEHAIKVTELCVRVYERDHNPVYLAAALNTTRRLNEVGLNLY